MKITSSVELTRDEIVELLGVCKVGYQGGKIFDETPVQKMKNRIFKDAIRKLKLALDSDAICRIEKETSNAG